MTDPGSPREDGTGGERQRKPEPGPFLEPSPMSGLTEIWKDYKGEVLMVGAVLALVFLAFWLRSRAFPQGSSSEEWSN